MDYAAELRALIEFAIAGSWAYGLLLVIVAPFVHRYIGR